MEQSVQLIDLTSDVKVCKVCRRTKDLGEFVKDSYNPSGHSNQCKTCFSVGIRKCTACKREKSMTDFTKDASKPSGYTSRCKSCTTLYNQIQNLRKKSNEIEESPNEKRQKIEPKELSVLQMAVDQEGTQELPTEEVIVEASGIIPIRQETYENPEEAPMYAVIERPQSAANLAFIDSLKNSPILGYPSEGADYRNGYRTLSMTAFEGSKRMSYCNPNDRCESCFRFIASIDLTDPTKRKHASGCLERPPEKIKKMKKTYVKKIIGVVPTPAQITKEEPNQKFVETLQTCEKCKLELCLYKFPILLSGKCFVFSRTCVNCGSK